MPKTFNASRFLEPIVLLIIIILVAVTLVLFAGANTYQGVEWLLVICMIFLVIVNLVSVVFLNRIYERLGTKGGKK